MGLGLAGEAYTKGLLAGGVTMSAKTIVEIMMTTNASAITRHP
jgi:hypothetical protein